MSEHGNGVHVAELRQMIERIERLEGDKKAISQDITEFYREAKGRGYDTKAMRALVRERAKDPGAASEERAILDLYRDALSGTPMGDYIETKIAAE